MRRYSSEGEGEGGKVGEGNGERERAVRGGPVVVKDQASVVGCEGIFSLLGV